MKNYLMFLGVGIIIIMAVKGLIDSPVSIDDYIFVSNTDEKGEQDNIILTPEEEMIYIKTFQDIVEAGEYKITGKKATHYVLGLYCFDSFPFGLRYYKNAEKVFDTELKLLKKEGDSFPNIGTSFNAKIIIFKDKAIIGKHSYKRIHLNNKEKEEFIRIIDQIKSSI